MQNIFQPSLATPLKIDNLPTFIESPDWCCEQKLDGQRVVVSVENGKATAVGRRNVLTIDPRIMQAVENIKVDCVLDGELVGGKLWFFDSPTISGISEWDTPYNERRQLLTVITKPLIAAVPDQIGLLPSLTSEADKQGLWNWCVKHGTEGLVVKKNDAPYIVGRRSLNWLKAKFVKTCDVFILETAIDGKRNAAVGVYNAAGDVVPIGTVTMTDRRLTVANRGDILEVRYLYASEDSRLVQPHVLRFRTDKPIEQCTIDQLQFTNKSIVFDG